MELLVILNLKDPIDNKYTIQDDIEDLKMVIGDQITILRGKDRIVKAVLEQVDEGENEMDTKKMGALMQAVRKKKNIKAADLDSVCSTAYLSQVENGHTIPSMAKFIAWCKRMDIKPHLLIKKFEDLGVFDVDPS